MKVRGRVYAAVLGLCAAAAVAHAQHYPTKPMRLIVGPGPDVLARLVGQKLTEQWSQQVVVDQRPGASGLIAVELMAKALPDGYTLLLSSGSYLASTSALSAHELGAPAQTRVRL
jgi:tripartite-type tricarboxylate transporter receptor subunit TctC